MTLHFKFIIGLFMVAVWAFQPSLATQETDPKSLEVLTAKLCSDAQEKGGVLMLISYPISADDFPTDYPNLGAIKVSKQCAQSLVDWSETIHKTAHSDKFTTGAVEKADVLGISAAVVPVRQSAPNGKHVKDFKISWMQSRTGKRWCFLGVEEIEVAKVNDNRNAYTGKQKRIGIADISGWEVYSDTTHLERGEVKFSHGGGSTRFSIAVYKHDAPFDIKRKDFVRQSEAELKSQGVDLEKTSFIDFQGHTGLCIDATFEALDESDSFLRTIAFFKGDQFIQLTVATDSADFLEHKNFKKMIEGLSVR